MNRKQIRLISDNDFEFFRAKDGKTLYVKTIGENIEVENGNQPLELQSLNSLADEYDSIDELYEFRKMYNAVLFNEWGKTHTLLQPVHPTEIKGKFTLEEFKTTVKYDVHKSWRHNDGELCFGGGWFIVSAMLPTGLISNHYKAEDWDLFQVPEVEKALYEFDGHTPQDVLARLEYLNKDVPGKEGSIKAITLGNGK